MEDMQETNHSTLLYIYIYVCVRVCTIITQCSYFLYNNITRSYLFPARADKIIMYYSNTQYMQLWLDIDLNMVYTKCCIITILEYSCQISKHLYMEWHGRD